MALYSVVISTIYVCVCGWQIFRHFATYVEHRNRQNSAFYVYASLVCTVYCEPSGEIHEQFHFCWCFSQAFSHVSMLCIPFECWWYLLLPFSFPLPRVSVHLFPSCCSSAFSPVYFTHGGRSIHFPCMTSNAIKMMFILCVSVCGCVHIFNWKFRRAKYAYVGYALFTRKKSKKKILVKIYNR